MEIISLPIFFCLYYYIICDLKLVRSVDEDSKPRNHTSGDLKQSGVSEQRAKSSDPLKEREERERNWSNSPTAQNPATPKSQQPASTSVTHTPTAEPTSEEEPSETPPETRDSTDPVSQEYESLEHDSTAVTEPPTTQPSSEEGHSEVSEETRDSADHVSKQKSETRSPEIKLIDLDLKKTNSSTEFDYSKNNNVVTYTPKVGYGFRTVKEGKGSCSCWSSDKVVWDAEDASKHSNKVVVESGSDKKKTLTIHGVDGTTKVFKKPKNGDFVLQNDDSTKDSNPVDSSPVTDAPTDDPTSEEEPTEVSEALESRDNHMTPSYQQNYPSGSHDSSRCREDRNRERH